VEKLIKQKKYERGRAYSHVKLPTILYENKILLPPDISSWDGDN